MVKQASSIEAKIYKPKKLPSIEVACAWCGKIFKASPHRIKRAKNLFCSEDHRRIGRNLDGGNTVRQKERRKFNPFNRYS